MENIISYITEEFIKKILDLKLEFYKEPRNIADLVVSTRMETDEIARRIIQEVLQEMNEMIKGLPAATHLLVSIALPPPKPMVQSHSFSAANF